jgi:hypothetical protein
METSSRGQATDSPCRRRESTSNVASAAGRGWADTFVNRPIWHGIESSATREVRAPVRELDECADSGGSLSAPRRRRVRSLEVSASCELPTLVGMTDASRSRRDEALVLADELLSDIELGRIEPVAIARKAGRLARLLDDAEAMKWLAFEATGYPDTLDPEAWAAVVRSRRVSGTGEAARAFTTPLGRLSAEIDSAMTRIGTGTGERSYGQQSLLVERENAARSNALHEYLGVARERLDKVVGAIHEYVGARYQELRFGAAVESAFQVVRKQVDGAIASLVPEGLSMIAAAFENASSNQPEHWQNAASTCRRLLMIAADRLRPPGPDVGGRKMGPGNYINRLVDWIVNQAESETAARMITADLEYLGPRLDAADSAGQKGAHVGSRPVTRLDASRFITGTYLVLGDILRIRDSLPAASIEPSAESDAETSPSGEP